MTLEIATFKNKHDNVPVPKEVTWAKLTGVLTTHVERQEKDGMLWSPTLYKPNTTRGNANVVSLSALVLDFDSGVQPEEMCANWADLAWCIHSTFGHTEAVPKWRAVFPFDQPVPGEVWGKTWERLVERFSGFAVDKTCKDASRMYYIASCLPGAPRLAVVHEGRTLQTASFVPPSVALLVLRAAEHLSEGRNHAGMLLAAQLRDNRYTQGEAERAAWHLAVPREKVNPNGQVDVYEEREWLDTVRRVYQTPARDPWGSNGNGHAPADRTSVVNVVLSSVVNIVKPPPKLEPEALHGLAGDVVRAIDPHTESHPAAILASFLTGVGCLIGRGPSIYRDGGRHTCNEFALLVGMTAKGRKGTATRRTDEIFKCLSDSEYNKKDDMPCMRPYSELIMSGLGSGEALIEELAEEATDKRRIVFEEEFSKPLKVMHREGSILSETLRAAWDGGILSNRTKGKKLIATDTHIAILGHVTEQELRQEIGKTSVYNGFGNRFLVFCTSRSKSLPFGGGRPHLAPVISQLRGVLDYSELIKEVEFDTAASRMWGNGGIYDMLMDRPEGMLGAVTSRAEAHVTRLALLYAVLDAAKEVRVEHLLAALAVWDYSERSARYIFGSASGDDYADLILERLREVYPGGLTRTEIRDVFKRNAEPGRIPQALASLEASGKVEHVSVPGEKGRPTEYWRFSSAYDLRQNDKNDLSPLQRARELLLNTNENNERTETP